ncbi:hypothetical protein I7I50_08982 [Histoplasma capsulatum G186AR]|uniref:Uncharacterized protein n=1 Tax=Ajellomyces capsulatus TaxID=5037 RepID=A0A8H7YTU5_AJECA|nr:hypothetical protein I7I52_06497 [Histoplasma capsulatum]QSS74005.1 hypothetical protein I7I50_08982 [Histoplasma capsulatum G186AR]
MTRPRKRRWRRYRTAPRFVVVTSEPPHEFQAQFCQGRLCVIEQARLRAQTLLVFHIQRKHQQPFHERPPHATRTDVGSCISKSCIRY